MRLSEAAGLSKDDIKLNESIPYVDIKPHPWRSLKTKSSIRKVPLVGASLWSARRILESDNNGPFAFPLYTNENMTNSNSGSAALNKWLRNRLGEGNVIHGFRHSMRDRLRAVECPSDLIDQIGGWSRGSIGEGYGKGYDLDIKWRWIEKLINKL
jgi:integrase